MSASERNKLENTSKKIKPIEEQLDKAIKNNSLVSYKELQEKNRKAESRIKTLDDLKVPIY